MDQNLQKKIDTLSCKYADDVTGYFAVDSDGMAKQNQNSWVSSWIQGSSYWIMLFILSVYSYKMLSVRKVVHWITDNNLNNPFAQKFLYKKAFI